MFMFCLGYPELHVPRGGERGPGGSPVLPRRRRGAQDQGVVPGKETSGIYSPKMLPPPPLSRNDYISSTRSPCHPRSQEIDR